MLKKYDFIFGIGSACLCSQTLRKLNLQFASYPLDWLFGTKFSDRVDFLLSDFKNFIEKEDLSFTGKQNGDPHHPCDIYANTRTGITFNHDFPQGIPLDISYPTVKEKYDRRIKRLLTGINNHKNILIVYIEVPGNQETETTSEVLINDLNRINQKFPDKNINFLYVSCSEDFSDEQITPHIRKISFNYKNTKSFPQHDARLLRRQIKGYRLKRPLSMRLKNRLYRIKKHLNNLKRRKFP